MKKLKIALHFIKIRLKNIGSILIKTSAGYAVATFGLIQVASVVTDNLSTELIFGISSESFMQILFIVVLVLFPIVLISIVGRWLWLIMTWISVIFIVMLLILWFTGLI